MRFFRSFGIPKEYRPESSVRAGFALRKVCIDREYISFERGHKGKQVAVWTTTEAIASYRKEPRSAPQAVGDRSIKKAGPNPVKDSGPLTLRVSVTLAVRFSSLRWHNPGPRLPPLRSFHTPKAPAERFRRGRGSSGDVSGRRC